MNTPVRVALILLAAFAAGCQPAGDKPVTPAATAAEQTRRAQAASREADRQTQDLDFAQRTEFAATMQSQLADLDRGMEDFAAKVAKGGTTLQREAAPQIEAWREQTAALKRQLGLLVNATPASWALIKTDAEKTHAALAARASQSRQWLADQLAR